MVTGVVRHNIIKSMPITFVKVDFTMLPHYAHGAKNLKFLRHASKKEVPLNHSLHRDVNYMSNENIKAQNILSTLRQI